LQVNRRRGEDLDIVTLPRQIAAETSKVSFRTAQCGRIALNEMSDPQGNLPFNALHSRHSDGGTATALDELLARRRRWLRVKRAPRSPRSRPLE
jgi:hypothetical protein